VTLRTARLDLVPITVPLVEAVLEGRREEAERILGASIPAAWPGRALVERAFYAELEAIRRDPTVRLWGDRVMITRDVPPRAVGSVVFHGAPDHQGAVEIAYGVEHESQSRGYATEAVLASVAWALEQPEVRVVRAATPPWHRGSQRVLEKCGMRRVGARESPIGEIDEWERWKDGPPRQRDPSRP
jgi:ribosomal-protein-alanine N-acetyltransferase